MPWPWRRSRGAPSPEIRPPRKAQVILADFGLSKELDGPTLTVCGTPCFLAPEILRGKGYSFPVDWWAFGVMLYDFACGETPFDAETPYLICAKVMATPRVIVYPESLDRLTRDLIEALLVGAPSKRLGSSLGSPGGALGGSTAVRAHAFFDELDFGALERRELVAPWPTHAKEQWSRIVRGVAEESGDDGGCLEPPWLGSQPCVEDPDFPGWSDATD